MTSAQADNKIGVADSPTTDPSSGRTFPVNDYAFERIIYRAPREALALIPWPDGLAPVGFPYDRAADQPLPPAMWSS